MSTKGKQNSGENENMCVVCFKNVDIYSIGICDHPVCFECSTRMRVLCRQNECPICRQDMPKVIYCHTVQPFRNLKAYYANSPLIDKKFGTWFQNSDIQRAYYKLLEHNCQKCSRLEPFRNFNQLKEHMRREHELHYCDLCVANLRIFTWERRCYTRSELAQHRRKGDADDTSHRGHPLCEFCDTRYMDSDELFRHLRRDHLFCHFCDADGLHQYYPNYECLRQHFEAEHYLCEEGECINEKFTSVFRTDIDLKAHRASVHGKLLGKAASKQARTLELEFTLAPRPRPDPPSGRNNRKPNSVTHNTNQTERCQEEGAVGYESYYTEPGGPSRGVTLTAQDFPSLGGGPGSAAAAPPLRPGGNVTIRHITRGQNAHALARTNENFPALAGDSSTVRFSVNSTIGPSDQSSSSTPNVSIHVNHRPNGAITTHISQNNHPNPGASSVRVRPRQDAFPALGPTPVQPPTEATWGKQSAAPPKPKVSKVAPAPILPSRDSPTDFPSLSGNSTKPDQKAKKSTSLTVPVSSSWASEPESKENKSKTKKKKSKNVSNNNTTENNKTTSASENKSNVTNNNNNNKKDKKEERKDTTKQNGVVKKRSELKIDSLQITDASTSEHEDFPSLSAKPPPGFVVQPPPGFAANDLTFTNSSGQSYSILPTHQFSPPPNFSQRNKKLVESFMTTLSSQESILEFKNLSSMFRNGMYTADQYYTHCKQVMKADFTKIFPELLVLLPDIDKQQDLYAIHCKNSTNKKGLEVCATCRQVMSSADLRSHLNTHSLQNHFPALGSQEVSSVWKK